MKDDQLVEQNSELVCAWTNITSFRTELLLLN